MIKHPREKGRRLERMVAQMIEEAGLGKAIRTPLSGGGGIPGDVITQLPVFIEVKNQARWNIPQWWDETVNRMPLGGKTPLLIIGKEYSRPFVFLKFEDLLEIMSYAKTGGWK